jgi:hypothetical protein
MPGVGDVQADWARVARVQWSACSRPRARGNFRRRPRPEDRDVRCLRQDAGFSADPSDEAAFSARFSVATSAPSSAWSC